MALPKAAITPTLIGTISLTVSAVNSNSTLVETYTLNGIDVDNFIQCVPVSPPAGLRILAARASANNTLELVWENMTGSQIASAARGVNFLVF